MMKKEDEERGNGSTVGNVFLPWLYGYQLHDGKQIGKSADALQELPIDYRSIRFEKGHT